VARMNVEAQLPDRHDDPVLFEALIKRPKIAWPTIMLLVAAYVLFGVSTLAYVEGKLSLYWAILINTTAAYMSFTPAHDASHNAVSSNRQLNEWVGRIATVLQSPVPFFRTFRYIHMQHHRFTNDETRDPDAYVGAGPHWLLPFRWATLDLNYFYYYLKPSVFMQRPKSERKEFYQAIVFGVLVFTAVSFAGWLDYYLLLFLVPTRLTAPSLSQGPVLSLPQSLESEEALSRVARSGDSRYLRVGAKEENASCARTDLTRSYTQNRQVQSL